MCQACDPWYKGVLCTLSISILIVRLITPLHVLSRTARSQLARSNGHAPPRIVRRPRPVQSRVERQPRRTGTKPQDRTRRVNSVGCGKRWDAGKWPDECQDSREMHDAEVCTSPQRMEQGPCRGGHNTPRARSQRRRRGWRGGCESVYSALRRRRHLVHDRGLLLGLGLVYSACPWSFWSSWRNGLQAPSCARGLGCSYADSRVLTATRQLARVVMKS